MTQFQAEKKLLAMANERGYTPWGTYHDSTGATIRFKGLTIFMFMNYMALWFSDSTPMRILFYKDMEEIDYKLVMRKIAIAEEANK